MNATTRNSVQYRNMNFHLFNYKATEQVVISYVKPLPVDVAIEAAEVVLFGHIQDSLHPRLPGLLLLGQGLLLHLLPVGRGHELLLVRELVSLRLSLFLHLQYARAEKFNQYCGGRNLRSSNEEIRNLIVCLYKLVRGFMWFLYLASVPSGPDVVH